MPAIYQIKITYAHDESVWRLVEFAEADTLHDVHDAIQEFFELDNDHLYAFFLSGKPWDRKSQYGAPQGRAAHERAAEQTSLGSLRIGAGKKFVYVFDFGDELWFDLEVKAVLPAEDNQPYPRLAASEGAAPQQYAGWNDDEPDEDDSPIELGELQPLADELDEVLALLEAEGGDEADHEDGGETFTPFDPALLLRLHIIAKSLFAVLVANETDFENIERSSKYDVSGWIDDLPLLLAGHGLVDEGVELCQMFGRLPDAWAFGSNLAIILAKAGRADEAQNLCSAHDRSIHRKLKNNRRLRLSIWAHRQE